MTKINDMYNFLNNVYENGLMTKFLVNIFDYEGIEDYNYISRISVNGKCVIMDVYDNVTKNRFNRYCFNFEKSDTYFYREEKDSIYVSNISVLEASESDNKLVNFAYLFTLSGNKKKTYAKTFLYPELVNILYSSNK